MNKTEWFGELPSTWDVTRLKNVLIERNESNKPVKTDFILSLTNDRGVIPYSEKGAVGNNSKDDITGYKLAYPKDLVLNSMNVVIGSVGISEYFGCVSPVYYMLRPRNHEDPVEFYNYLFQTNEMQSALKGYGNGIMEIRMRIAMSKLNTFNLPIPSSQAQRKIVDRIRESENRIDQLIANQQQQIEKLKEYKQSLLSEVVTKGLDPKVEFIDSGVEWIGKIPKHWDLIRVKDLSTNTTLRNNNPNLQYIALENIESQSYRFIDTDNEYDPNEGILALRYSVLFGKLRPYLAKSFYCENDVSCSSEFAVFPFENEVTSKYFLLLTQSIGFIDTINMSTYGTKMPRANINYINNLSVQLPPYDEQKLIVDFLMNRISIIEKILSIKDIKIKELEDYKKSLIYEYVTGKKEVS